MKKLTIKQIAERAGIEIAVSVFGCADGRPWSQRFRKGWDTQRNAVAGKAAEVIEKLLCTMTISCKECAVFGVPNPSCRLCNGTGEIDLGREIKLSNFTGGWMP